MTLRGGFGGWWAELGGQQNIVPDESGTYDRMNPVFLQAQGLSGGGRSLGGRQNIVPDESGTNDRMNPVFRHGLDSSFHSE
jgi:hypothetical protein